MGLSQARIERFFLDTIRGCSDIDVERGVVAESLAYTDDVEIDGSDVYPITVKLRALSEEEANAGLPYGDLRIIDRSNVPQDEWDDLTPRKTKSPGETEMLKAKFIIGSDGAHSWTRKQLNIPLEGSSTEALWYCILFVVHVCKTDFWQGCYGCDRHNRLSFVPFFWRHCAGLTCS